MARRRRTYPPKITLAELKQQCQKYWRKERRDAMYLIALGHLRKSRGRPADMADGLAVMLLTWNQAAYRYGAFDHRRLERFVDERGGVLHGFRRRNIRSFDAKKDGNAVRDLFNKLLAALHVKANGRRSPVGAAKALHLLAPTFFALWDAEIAKKTGVYWHDSKKAADRYIEMMQDAKEAVIALEDKYASGVRGGLPDAAGVGAALTELGGREKSLLKFLDEYYYAKFKLGIKKGERRTKRRSS
jgi:hypothetical protein